MIHRYDEFTQKQLDRQGQFWVFCDAEDCGAEAHVDDVQEVELRGRVLREANMPQGWVTSDPDGNALAGAANYCPAHADLIPEAPEEEVEPISDESQPEVPVEPTP